MYEGKVGSRYLREWKQDNNKGNIVIIHGVGEHSGRYADTATQLFEKGYNVVTGDLKGHGISEGTKVYINSIQEYMDDVDFLLQRVDNNKPTFILGHSMGGLIVLYYMLKNSRKDIKGAIVSSPYIKDKMKISPMKYWLGKAAAAIYPTLRIESGLTGDMVCRDKAIVEMYNKDELNCSKVTAKWFVELEKARKYLMQNAKNFDVPCLILQAGDDVVVDPEGVKEFYHGIGSKDKHMIVYEGFYHEILNEPERDRVLQDIQNWLDARI